MTHGHSEPRRGGERTGSPEAQRCGVWITREKKNYLWGNWFPHEALIYVPGGIFVALSAGKANYDQLVVSIFSTNLVSLTAYIYRNADNVIWIYFKMMVWRC